jgi:glycosyltransferase involved in cell wall biosynthesis
MPDLYRSADVFLHLSLLESFGNVFLESWASGLPIVAHDSDRLRWILGDRHYLCDTTVPHELGAALRAAMSAPANAARDGVERYSWATIGAEYRAFLSETVARRRSV